MTTFRYFHGAFSFTLFGLSFGAWIGWFYTGTIGGAVYFFFICCILAIIEISLSFDNSIVNAKVLGDMDHIWQKRFLTWGIFVSVFGMRIFFPLAIITVITGSNPLSALYFALSKPDCYARIMEDAHIRISAFGGTFLMMVGLKYFFNEDKYVHWISPLEKGMQKLVSFKGIEIIITLSCIFIIAELLDMEEKKHVFFLSAVCGLFSSLVTDGLSAYLNLSEGKINVLRRGGPSAFIYLEVLDASFSFDGTIGAFALSKNFLIIAIGLSIGAFYVRSMTLMLVEKKTLAHYCYLEHGAFYAILSMAFIMYLQSLVHIPELVTGLVSSCFIIAALFSSLKKIREGGMND